MDGNTGSEETKQRKRARARSPKAIRESEEWLFSTLESIGDAVVATDATGRVVFMNRVAVDLTGWSADDAQGRDCREVFRIVNESTREETESPVTKVIRDGVVSGLANHTILIARDGTERYIDDSGSPTRDVSGNLVGVVLIFRDVTERRKMELTVDEQRQLLQSLFDHIPVMVAILGASGQFKWANREFSRLTGWSAQDMNLHGRVADLFPEPSMASEPLAPADGPPIGWRDLRLTTQDGRELDIMWATVLLSDGTVLGIGQDMTRRANGEEDRSRLVRSIDEHNLRLRQAMRESNHRVKNNLQFVAALLDVQAMENQGSIPAQEVAHIRNHITSLAAIHDILVQDVAGQGLERSFSARTELLKLLPLLQETMGDCNIEWNFEDVRLTVKQGMALAILVNELVTNAVKHGGQRVRLRLAVLNRTAALEVSDDGPGFPTAFQPEAPGAFGLELVETVGRVDLGGQTAYENLPQGGACVRVTFPMSKAVAL